MSLPFVADRCPSSNPRSSHVRSCVDQSPTESPTSRALTASKRDSDSSLTNSPWCMPFKVVMGWTISQEEGLTLRCTTESICYINIETAGRDSLVGCRNVGKTLKIVSQLTFCRLSVMQRLSDWAACSSTGTIITILRLGKLSKTAR